MSFKSLFSVAGLAFLAAGLADAQSLQYFYDSSGNVVIRTVENVFPPQITGQPVAQVAESGDVVTFSVVLADVSGVTFQWLFNGVNILGATGDSLVLTNVGEASRGLYSVVVSNSSGTNTSAAAVLALEKTWNGSASSDWFNANNWTPAGVPGVNDTIHFFGGTINLTAPVTINGQFNWLSGTLTGSALAVATNGVLNITGSVALQSALTDNGTVDFSGGTLTLTAPMTVNGQFNWQNGTVTGSSLTVVANGVLNITGSVALQSALAGSGTVNFSGGTLNLAAPNTVNGRFNWLSGTLTGSALNVASNGVVNMGASVAMQNAQTTVSGILNWGGNSTVAASLLVAAGGTVNWSGGVAYGLLMVGTNGVLNVSGSVGFQNPLTNSGTVNWLGGNIEVQNSTTCGYNYWPAWIVNSAGGVWNIQCDQLMFDSYCGNPYFQNAGTVQKTGNAGTTTFSIPFFNIGAVAASQGTLNFHAGGTIEGTYSAASGTAIVFSGGVFSYGTAPVLSGLGTFLFSGGTLTLLNNVIPGLQMVGGTLNLAAGFQGGAITNLTLSGMTLNGNNTVSGTLNCGGNSGLAGSLLVAAGGTVNWSGGTASGVLTVATNGVVNIGGSVGLQNALTNNGTVNWLAGNIEVQNSTTCGYNYWPAWIVNSAGGVWNIQCDQLMFDSYCGNPYFRNAGTVQKTGNTGTTTISIPFYNTGAVAALQGTLNFHAGGTIEGTYSAASGTAIVFSGGVFSYGTAPVLSGLGTFLFSGGTLTLLNNVIPGLQMVGGTLNLAAGFQGGAITNLTLSGMTLNGNNTVSGTLNCGGNSGLGGRLLVAAGGTLNWSGGTAYGALSVATNGVVNIGGSVGLQNALTNNGTVNWLAGNIEVQNSTTCGYNYWPAWIVNSAGGVWNIQCDQLMFDSYCGNPYFQNVGTIQKSASTGTTTFTILLLNPGTVAILQGTLALNGGFTPGNGTLSLGISSLTSFGRINFSGNATLGGTVGATWLGGYVPALSNSFAVVTYGSRAGIFTKLDLPSAAAWQTNYGSTAFTLTVASISKLVFTAAPSNTNAGAILPPVAVQVQDVSGNPIATNGVPVTMTLSSGSGTLSGTLTRNTDPTGMATFSDLSINQGGAKTLTASADGLTPATGVFQVLQQVAPPAGIVAWWRAENNALDSVSTNNGTLMNGAGYAAGEVGQAFSLNGVNQSISVSDAPALRPASVTIEAWVMFDSASGVRVIFAKPLGAGFLDSYSLFLNAGNLQGVVSDAAGLGPVLSVPFSPVLGQWYHAAYTFDDLSKQQALYLNGAQVASGAANKTIGYDTQPMLLGRDTENGTPNYFFSGSIDEAAIYNRALSAAEVASIYNAGPLGKAFSPLVLRASVQGETLLLSFAATPGKAYTIQSANALNAGVWGLLTNTVASSTNVVCSDSITNAPQRFYRVVTGN